MNNIKKIILIFLLMSCPWYCAGTQADYVHYLKNHPPFKTGPFVERIGEDSKIVLEHLKKLDERDDYSFYTPSSEEMALIRKEAAFIPPFLRDALDSKVIGIYFVNNLLGSGLTEWVSSDNGTYSFIALNPRVLKKNISELLTEKENSCFIPDPAGKISLKINCGSDYSGFVYILIHEAVHVADYYHRITPFVDPSFRGFYSIKSSESPFTRGVWTGYSDTGEKFGFRKDVTFYGFRGGPRMKISEALFTYGLLEQSPFVSLYATLNWAEDIAEYVTFYHLTGTLGTGYAVELFSGGKLIYKYEPFNRDEIIMRSASIGEFIYRRR